MEFEPAPAKHKAEREGFHDALMPDYRGLVAEATGANVFFVMQDGRIHTPVPDCFLDGIARRTVIELAKSRGYEVGERQIRPEEMADAAECFLTGTAAEVTPVGPIAGYGFTPGDITRALVEGYDAPVRTPSGVVLTRLPPEAECSSPCFSRISQPVLAGQSLDAREFALVVGHDDAVEGNGLGGDQHVIAANRLAGPFEPTRKPFRRTTPPGAPWPES